MAQQNGSFEHGEVVERARRLAAAPFEEDGQPLPDLLRNLDYDAYRDIRFRPDKALLADGGGPFRLQLFHPGFLYRHTETISIVANGMAVPIPFSTSLFDYGRTKLDGPLPVNLGFAGFRLHYPLNRPDVLDELAAFLGATYFRILGRGHRYGVSARLISLRSGRTGEEFPFFRAFWIEQPGPGAERIVIHGLFDGPSVAGACRMVLTPGPQTTMEIGLTLFARAANVRPGIAPLTSMFLTSESDRRVLDDFRAEIHDSDGFLMHSQEGEWLWRPLRNPPEPAISSLAAANLRGFGLMQRDRAFHRYEDLEARYDLRPSYWVEPLNGWGGGTIELVELPTPDETNDNIVASWIPERPMNPGERLELSYRVSAVADPWSMHAGGRAAQTFQAAVRPPAPAGSPPRRRFLIDFTGGDLRFWSNDPSRIELVASASGGAVLRRSVEANPITGGVRASLDVQAGGEKQVDLRAFLRAGNRTLSETWAFPWRPG
jgi:glucans biosynthesis protein